MKGTRPAATRFCFGATHGANRDLNEEIQSLTNFIERLRFDNQLVPDISQGSTVLLSRGDRTIILAGKDADGYTDIKSSICDALAARRSVSKKAVNGLVDDFFFRTLRAGDSAENPNLANQLREGTQVFKAALFEKPRNWEVQRIVEGLAPSGLPLVVGQVQFQYLDETGLADLKAKKSNRARDLHPRDLDEVLARLASSLEVFRGKVMATLAVSAVVDEEAAIEAAKHVLQITVDAINLFSPREPMGGWAFLPGDTMPQRELVLAFCEDKLMPSFRSVGPLRQIPLNQIAKRSGFARVSDILRKEIPSDLEDKVLASVRWAGRAQVEARREEAFLLYAIALESLVLTKETKTELSYRLAVRCAQIGGGPTLEDKKRVVDQIQSLYDLRSRIVHSGNFAVSEEDLSLIGRYAVSTLLIVIEQEPFRSMSTVREFETWLETQLLSGGVVRT